MQRVFIEKNHIFIAVVQKSVYNGKKVLLVTTPEKVMADLYLRF